MACTSEVGRITQLSVQDASVIKVITRQRVYSGSVTPSLRLSPHSLPLFTPFAESPMSSDLAGVDKVKQER